MQHLEIKWHVIFAFYLQVNKMVECGHKPIVNAFAKITNRDFNKWVENLLTVA